MEETKKHTPSFVTDPDQIVRRKILGNLITKDFTLAAVSRMFGKPDRQIRDMLDLRKPFGANVARGMERHAINNGHSEIYLYFFDGVEPQINNQANQELEAYGVNGELKDSLIHLFNGLTDDHKDDVIKYANQLYSLDNPNDRKANPITMKGKVK